MYTTKDIKSITVQSVHLIIIHTNDNKSYIIDDNELVDMINKKIYLKKCRKSRVSARVSDDLKARLDDYESEIRGRMSKCRDKSEGKCDQGSDLGAAEAAHIPPPQATQLPTQVVSAPCSPLESKVSDFISNSFSSNSPSSPNPTDNSIDKPIVINSTINTPIDTPIDTPINTPTISDCINTINTDVNTINTGNNSSNSYCCKIDTSISSSRCNNDNPSISDTTHIKTSNSSSKRVNSSSNSTNRFNRFKRFIKTIKSIFKTTRYN